MAARSEAEVTSLLVYKSPAWKGGVLYFGIVLLAAMLLDSEVNKAVDPCSRLGSYLQKATMPGRSRSLLFAVYGQAGHKSQETKNNAVQGASKMRSARARLSWRSSCLFSAFATPRRSRSNNSKKRWGSTSCFNEISARRWPVH